MIREVLTKRLVPVMILCLILQSFSMNPSVSASASNNDMKQSGLTLINNKRVESAVIWWSKDSSSTVTPYAAAELQSYLKKMTGSKVPIVKGTPAGESSGLDHLSSALIVVTGDDAKNYTDNNQGASFPIEWLSSANNKLNGAKEDSFVTETAGNQIVLAGENDRGTLYSAYEMLESLGVHFFAPNFKYYNNFAELVPQNSTVVVSSLTEGIHEPDFKVRRKYVEEGWSHSSENLPALIDWMAKNKLNTLVVPYDYIAEGNTRWDDWRQQLIPELSKRDILVEVGGHGFESFLRKDKYGAAHPDWFISGYNVFNIANEEAVDTYVSEVISYLKERPEIGIFDAWPPDVASWPPVVIAKFGSSANAYAYVVNKLHAKVQQELPGVRIEAIAYSTHDQPPSSEYMYDESILIDFAPYFRSYRDSVFDPNSSVNKPSVNLINKWSSVFSGDLTMYEYYRRYAFHSLPVVFPKLIGEELPYYKTIGMNGIGTYSEPGDWITFEITHLILAKMSWNSDSNPEELISNYVQARFGNATDEMAQYFNLVEEAGRAVFNQPTGDYNNLNAVTKARNNYLQAKSLLSTALEKAPSASSMAFMIERLGWNIDFAIADTEAEFYRLGNDTAKVREAKLQAQALLYTHRFDGIMLQNSYSLRRYLSGFGQSAWIYKLNRGELKQAPMTSFGTYQNNDIGNIVDGNEETVYWSNVNPVSGDYVGVDLQSVQKIKQINLLMSTSAKPNDYIRQGVIEVSSDFKEWRTIAESTNQAEIKLTIEDGTEARFIRFRSIGSQTQWVIVREFTVSAEAIDEPGEDGELRTTLVTDKSEVLPGESVNVVMGIKDMSNPAYALDINLEYDPSVLEFVSSKSIKDGISLVETKSSSGKIRLIAASEGEQHALSTGADIVELTFVGKETDVPVTAAIKVQEAVLGDSEGEEVQAASSSTSVTVQPDTTPIPDSDVNGDGKVSIGDLGIVAAHYGKDSTSPDWQQAKRADVNKDGKIDIADLALIAKKITE
ncbi:DUF4838 domain-containing protein [Paenibacillus sp. GCM10028914]|uniref:DUF4838 domain-containing protein n=1 Tax=Paenibacillus sp. GCM10028914 TaxID=3273416 RepID=UPI00361D395F